MRVLLRMVGLALVGIGLFLLVLPFSSVFRLTNQVLAEVPTVPGAEVVEDRHVVSAMWQDNFELAQRTYPAGVTTDQVIDALGDEFASGSFGEDGYSKSCCGDYDAVIVRISENPDGQVTQALTVFDSDIQASYGIIMIVGLMFGFAGLVVFRAPSSAARRADGHHTDDLVDA